MRPYWATGTRGGGEMWRVVFALDYFGHWSHHTLSALMSLSSSSCVSNDPSESSSSLRVHRFGSLSFSLSVTLLPSSPALSFHLTPEPLHGTFLHRRCVVLCVLVMPGLRFLLVSHLLLSSADWMNSCF